jgi:hypothetical protein
MSFEEDLFEDDDTGDMSKVPAFGMKGLKVETTK